MSKPMATPKKSAIEKDFSANTRRKFEVLRSRLTTERSSFIPHWRDLADYIRPRRAKFTLVDRNRGDRRNQKIIDTTPTLCSRTLRSGMMGGITSPARPWFALTTPDPMLAETASVKEWLYVVNQRMVTVFNQSNLYQTLPILYGDLGDFGTGAMFIEEDFDKVIQCTAIPIGEYMIANNKNGRVGVFFREFSMTVRQVVEKWGMREDSSDIDWSRISIRIRQLWEEDNKEAWIEICHVAQQNPEYDPKKLDSRYKKFVSVYYERGTMTGTTGSYMDEVNVDTTLATSGYDYFPALVPRWEVAGTDAYATDCPGMTSLGDNKQLQMGEKRGAQALEKMINPPMTAPTSLRNQKSSILPGDVTYVDAREGQQGFKAAHEINFRLDILEQKQEQIRERIRKAYFEDLFLMLSNDDRSGVTATEITEKKEEKLLALGPVLEQLNQDCLDPLIDITFMMMHRQGLIPPAPKEIQGMPLKVQYTSIMAQAQKLIGISSIERMLGFTVHAMSIDPRAADKIDIDQMVDIYSDMISVPPGGIRTDDAVAARREQIQKAQQAQAMAAQIQQGASAAKDLSQADTGGNNALTQLLSQSQAGAIAPGQ